MEAECRTQLGFGRLSLVPGRLRDRFLVGVPTPLPIGGRVEWMEGEGERALPRSHSLDGSALKLLEKVDC